MSEDRKTTGAGFWITVVVVVMLVAYPLSFGPACWLLASDILSYHQVECIFRPLVYMTFNGPEIAQQSLRLYLSLWNGEQALLI